MNGRIAGALVLEVGITVVLSLLVGGVFSLAFSSGPVEAMFVDGPRMLVVGMGVGYLAWLVLLALAALRHHKRPGRWKVGTSVLAAIIAVLVNLVVVAISGIVTGGWGLFILVFGIEAGIAFLVSAIAAALIVHVGVLGRKPQPEAVSGT